MPARELESVPSTPRRDAVKTATSLEVANSTLEDLKKSLSDRIFEYFST